MSKETSFTSIDKHRLDEELEKQADLYRDYAEQLADAKLDLNEESDLLEVIEAEVSMEIRGNPGKFGLDKVTEDVIKKAVILHPNVRQAKKAVNQAKHKVDILLAATMGLSHKKDALGNMVYLHTSGYFAEVKLPSEKKGEVDDMRRKKMYAVGKKREGPQ